MIGYRLYFVPPDEIDDQTGETWESEPLPLHLTFGSYSEAVTARNVLETVYGTGRVEIDSFAGLNTYVPGEGA